MILMKCCHLLYFTPLLPPLLSRELFLWLFIGLRAAAPGHGAFLTARHQKPRRWKVDGRLAGQQEVLMG